MLCLRIESLSPDLPDVEWVVRIEQQPMHHQTHQAAVPSICRYRFPNVLLDMLVRVAERLVHLDLDDAFFIGREVVGNIVERDECRRGHEELAEDHR